MVALRTAAPFGERGAFPFRHGRQHEAADQISARKCHALRTVPGMGKPPGRYEVTVRVAKG